MGSKATLLLLPLFTAVLLISSEAAARDLTKSSFEGNIAEEDSRADNVKYPGYVGYNRGYPDRAVYGCGNPDCGGYGVGYPTRGGCGGGYPGRGSHGPVAIPAEKGIAGMVAAEEDTTEEVVEDAARSYAREAVEAADAETKAKPHN